MKNPPTIVCAFLLLVLSAAPAASHGGEGIGSMIGDLYKLRGKGEEAITAYRAALSHDSPKVRTAATELIASEAGADAIPDLVRILREEKSEAVLVAAVKGLLPLDDPRVVASIVELLENGPDRVRVETTAYISDNADSRFLAQLGTLISDPHVGLRRTAVGALQQIGTTEVFPFLMAATSDGDREVVYDAVRALQSLGDARAIPRLKILAKNPQPLVRSAVATALIVLGGLDSEAETIDKLLSDDDPAVRIGVVAGLRDAPDVKNSPLLAIAAKDKDPRIRRLAVIALKLSPDPRADEILADLLRDGEARVRAATLMALGLRGSTELLGAPGSAGSPDAGDPGPRMADCIDDPDPTVRVALADALGYLGSPATLEHLAVLVRDEVPDVRMSSLDSAARIGRPESIKILALGLEDSEVLVRRAAVLGLGAVGNPEALVQLREAVDDPDLQIRLTAIELLGRNRDLESAELLKKASRDPAEAVRRAARKALEQLGLEAAEQRAP